ncbi:MAG: hypothetical protein OSJ74_10270, partial [Clostridia bacterium]|nr:hypothetical protein [Clostridia bacterium]
ESAKKMIFFQNATKQSFDTLTRYNESAESAMENVRKNIAAFEEVNRQISDIASVDMSDCDEKQLDYYAKQLEKLEQRADELDREIARANKELSDINIKQKKEYEQAGKSSKSYRVYTEEFNNLKKEKSVEANAIMKDLKDLEKSAASYVVASLTVAVGVVLAVSSLLRLVGVKKENQVMQLGKSAMATFISYNTEKTSGKVAVYYIEYSFEDEGQKYICKSPSQFNWYEVLTLKVVGEFPIKTYKGRSVLDCDIMQMHLDNREAVAELNRKYEQALEELSSDK